MDTPTTEQPVEAKPETNYGLLAKKSYGNEFHGEAVEAPVEAPEEAPVEADPIEAAEEAPEAPVEEPTGEEALPEEAEAASEEDAPIDSWDELVESQAWEPEWANNLKVGVKVDGEESKVALSDLRASYQMQEAAEKRLNESKEKAKALNQAVSDKSDQLNQQFSVAAKLIENAEKLLDSDESNLDPNLRRDDPAEWSAKEREIEKRRQNLAKLKTDAQGEYQKAAQQNQAERDKQLAEVIDGEQQKLSTAIPEWANQEFAKADKAKVSKYLQSVGFSEQELSQAYDSRMIVMARKAMLHDERDTKIDPQKKRLKTVPRTLSPGTQKTETQTQQAQRDKLKARLKSSGKLEDAMALYRMK